MVQVRACVAAWVGARTELLGPDEMIAGASVAAHGASWYTVLPPGAGHLYTSALASPGRLSAIVNVRVAREVRIVLLFRV